jgi:hypothetical protein
MCKNTIKKYTKKSYSAAKLESKEVKISQRDLNSF